MSFPTSDLDAIASVAGDETLKFTRSEQKAINRALFIIREKRAQEQAEKREKARKKAEKAEALKKDRRIRGTRPFRFLDLPAELRNEIMDYAMGEEDVVGAGNDRKKFPLSRPVLPPLTRVSRQVRAEALGVFFSENSFWVTVYSNFSDRFEDRQYKILSGATGRAPPTPVKGRIAKSGLLGIKREVRNPLKFAIFRQVEFQMVDARIGRPRDVLDGGLDQVTAYLTLGVHHGAAQVAWRQGAYYPTVKTRYYRDRGTRQDMDATIQEAIRVANDIAAQHEDFKVSL